MNTTLTCAARTLSAIARSAVSAARGRGLLAAAVIAAAAVGWLSATAVHGQGQQGQGLEISAMPEDVKAQLDELFDLKGAAFVVIVDDDGNIQTLRGGTRPGRRINNPSFRVPGRPDSTDYVENIFISKVNPTFVTVCRKIGGVIVCDEYQV